MGNCEHACITTHLKSLHWLPIKVRSTYKIACLCYHYHSSTAPSYVADMLHKKPSHARNTRSSSYTMPLLNRPTHSKATLGDRSFSFASSSVWNSIPNDLRCAPSLLATSKRTKHLHNLPTSITIGNAQIPLKQSVMNLGATLDCHLTMNAHVSNIPRTCYFELRRLASIRRFLTSTATATLVSAFVLPRIDYYSSLLLGSTNDVTSHLQLRQNYAAQVILRLPMSSSITTHLKSLHWLPIKVRSTYKVACLCYHCHSSTAPSYVADMLHKKPSHTRNTRSSSYTMALLNRPTHSKATLGDRLFSFASSSVWNSIPNDLRCAPSLSSSKSRLKTYLLHSVYKD